MLYQSVITSPIGLLYLTANERTLLSVSFEKPAEFNAGDVEAKTELLKEVEQQLREYFSGMRTNFSIPILLDGTAFQNKVWQELQRIPYGEVISYSELAKRIGNEKAVRAVGGANNKNNIPIIIPCHRVVGKGGTLVGYAGGLDKKRKLLQIENGGTLLINNGT